MLQSTVGGEKKKEKRARIDKLPALHFVTKTHKTDDKIFFFFCSINLFIYLLLILIVIC